MRILMIVDYLPYPLVGGDRVRIYNLLRRVANQHEVSLAAFLETPDHAEAVPHLEQFCARVETASLQRRSPIAHIPGLIRYALERKPLELKFLHSDELTNKIDQLASTMDFDIVQLESRMGLYLEALPQDGRCKTILMFQNFTSQQSRRVFHIERRWSDKMRALLNSMVMYAWEPRYAQRFDCCTTVSEIDRSLLLKANHRLRVEVIPNGVDTGAYQPLPPETTPALLFIGNMSYPPCIDAMLYFCQEIFPRIRQLIGEVELWIVGRDPSPEIRQLDGGGVHVTGRVEDVIPYYRQCAVCVVPLRAGGGTRLKILEAMALCRPVVSTTIGCEGLDVTDGEHLLIADDLEQFAEKTVRLLEDHQLYQYLSAHGRRLVETHYDWDKIAEKLMGTYADLV
jgi:polysaccharide biosynthesis protein PslH